MDKNSPASKTDRIYLTGFMGSGKSAVGRILARRLDRPFVDLDDVLIRESGMTVTEMFRLKGEDGFRTLEARTAQRFTRGQWVVALGGGTLINKATRDLLTAEGTVVYLRARPDTLALRLRDQRDDRPLLAGDDPLESRVSRLLEEREGIYAVAHWVLDTDDLTVDQVAQRLHERVGGSLHA